MPSQELLMKAANDIRWFFEQARPDDPAKNQGLAREIIVRYGNELIAEGFAFALIGDDLRASPNMLALTHALNAAIMRFNYVTDFVMARGTTESKAVLGAIIQTSTDEDICALAALTIANPQIASPLLKDTLKKRYGSTEGTSCRMALALALLQCGDDSYLKKFIQQGYLYDYFKHPRDRSISSEDERNVIAFMFMGQLLKIVLEDCATDGHGVDVLYSLRQNSSLAWKRKVY